MSAIIRNFLREDRGVTSIEYALLGSLIAVVIVVAVTAIGVNVNNKFNSVKDATTFS